MRFLHIISAYNLHNINYVYDIFYFGLSSDSLWSSIISSSMASSLVVVVKVVVVTVVVVLVTEVVVSSGISATFTQGVA